VNSYWQRVAAEQKKQLKPKLLFRIHGAAMRGHKTALQLLLDMGADINEEVLLVKQHCGICFL